MRYIEVDDIYKNKYRIYVNGASLAYNIDSF